MCGIFCSVHFNPELCSLQQLSETLHRSLARRGPDYSSQYEVLSDKVKLFFMACVLHMRGELMTHQPAVSQTGDVLLWNGEIFGGLKVDGGTSDTIILLSELVRSGEVLRVLESVQGPWAIVFYQSATKKLWFGRDYFGRRSLLWKFDENAFVLSSVGTRSDASWREVSANGIFCLDLEKQASASHAERLTCFPWVSITSGVQKASCLGPQCTVQSGSQIVPPCSVSGLKEVVKSQCEEPVVLLGGGRLQQLVQSCHDKNLWDLCDTFLSVLKGAVMRRTRGRDSGQGVALLFSGGLDCTVLAALAHHCLPRDETIDLINVAFARQGLGGEGAAAKDLPKVPDRETGLASCAELRALFPSRRWRLVRANVSPDELRRLRAGRVADLAFPNETVLDDSIACAVWFAARGVGLATDDQDGGGDATDDRRCEEEVYRSAAKILLCGMGADEQLGGYSRHRGLFEKHRDWAVVDREIKMEIERISSRNLGRDDRVASDHGREARFPYLDEAVVAFLLDVDVSLKSDLRLPRGVGEKILLRGAAYTLGLRGACVEPKRAIQFGSRIAKAENRKEKGGDKCARLSLNLAG